MRELTKKQVLLVELVDQGLSVEEIASRTGKLVPSIKKQLARIRRKVREGHFAPSRFLLSKPRRRRAYILLASTYSERTRRLTASI